MPVQRGSIQIIATLCLSMVAILAGAAWINSRPPADSQEFTGLAANSRALSPTNSIPDQAGNASARLFAVAVRQPSGPPRIDLGIKNEHGEAVTAACSTCHSTRQPNLDTRTPGDLDEFHGGLNFAHGNLNCLSCHNPGDYDSLRLADGSRLEFADVMTLCSQCHGTQRRDYDHGVHGGMNGYWDLKQGPRTRNNCVDCHDPHAPKFPSMRRTFFPRDRFLNAEQDH